MSNAIEELFENKIFLAQTTKGKECIELFIVDYVRDSLSDYINELKERAKKYEHGNMINLGKAEAIHRIINDIEKALKK